MAASTPSYAAELDIALRTIHLASHLTKSVLRSLHNSVSAETKADDSPVTIADFAAQAIIISSLHAAYPSDTFIGEESADQLRRDDKLAARVWELVERARGMQEEQQQQQTALNNGESSEVQNVQGDGGSTTSASAGAATSAGQYANFKLTLPTSIPQMLDIIDLGTSTQTGTGRVWVLDPIDGTATFMLGKQYAVCLCLLVDGVQQVGVIGCPNLAYDFEASSSTSTSNPSQPQRIHEDLVDTTGHGVLLSAVRSQGTFIRRILSLTSPSLFSSPAKQIIHDVSPNRTIDWSALNFVESTLGKTSLSQSEHESVAETLSVASWPGTVVWSQQMKYVALALGATDVMVRIPKTKERYTYLWDHAGGHILFQEAGGVIRDFDGGEVDFGNGRKILGERNWGMVAALPGVFEGVVKAVGDVLERREG